MVASPRLRSRLVDCEMARADRSQEHFRPLLWGMVRTKKRDFTGAIEDFDEAYRISPTYAAAMSRKAYLLATCPDATIRDAHAAFELAKRSCELTNWKKGLQLSSLAAAHAALGQFEDAIQWQKKALDDPEYLQDDDENAKAPKRLAAYEKKQAWLEE